MKTLSLALRIFLTCFICTTLLFVAGCGDDDPVSTNPTWHWSPLGDGLPGTVWAVESYGGRLYAGGEFYVNNSDGLRVYSGRTWSRVGDTTAGIVTNGTVFGLTTYNNQLIVSGDFHISQPITANGIAAWNGHSWSALGGGLATGMVGGEMAVYDGNLYVGNQYWLTGMYIMRWDGSAWTTVMSGGDGRVKDMVLYDGKLIVSADSIFSGAGGATAWPWVRSWDGSTWTDMSNGVTSSQTLTVRNDSLFLCTAYGGELRVWTGSIWQTVASTTLEDDEHVSVVYQLACFDDKIILAGDFVQADSTACGNIVAWDGSAFAPLSCGVTGQNDPMVRTLKVIDDRLIVGGTFATIGTIESPHIAEWSYR